MAHSWKEGLFPGEAGEEGPLLIHCRDPRWLLCYNCDSVLCTLYKDYIVPRTRLELSLALNLQPSYIGTFVAWAHNTTDRFSYANIYSVEYMPQY
jgi:hypothetical protein